MKATPPDALSSLITSGREFFLVNTEKHGESWLNGGNKENKYSPQINRTDLKHLNV